MRHEAEGEKKGYVRKSKLCEQRRSRRITPVEKKKRVRGEQSDRKKTVCSLSIESGDHRKGCLVPCDLHTTWSAAIVAMPAGRCD